MSIMLMSHFLDYYSFLVVHKIRQYMFFFKIILCILHSLYPNVNVRISSSISIGKHIKITYNGLEYMNKFKNN